MYMKWIFIYVRSLNMNANLSSPYQERFRVGSLVELIVLLIPGILFEFVQLMILRESTFLKPVHVRLLMLNLSNLQNTFVASLLGCT